MRPIALSVIHIDNDRGRSVICWRNSREYTGKHATQGSPVVLNDEGLESQIMDVKSIKGIAVVSIEQGEKVGTVDDVLFDLDRKRIIAFKLIKPGFLRAGGIALKMEDTQSIGKDAVMIQNRERIRELKDERDLHGRADYDAISSLRVVTQDGTYVGNLATVQFDPHTGAFTHLEVTGPGFMDRLRRNQVVGISEVVSMGTDVVVIPDSYAPAQTDTEQEETRETEVEVDEGENPTEKRGEILQ
jgi:uncharacterized protein YrrD